MINVRVKAIMELAIVLGKHDFSISLPDSATVSRLFMAISDKYGAEAEKLLNDKSCSGQHPGLFVMINGSRTVYGDEFETPLKNGDEVYIVLPASGG